MPDWIYDIAKVVGGGVALTVCLSIPKLWVDIVVVKRETEEHGRKFAGLFARVDKISEDVSYIRGHIDHISK